MRILIAPNAFKHSLNATAAAEAIHEGLRESRLSCQCECFPIGDGGDGTGALLIKKHGGAWVDAEVWDPLGRSIRAQFGLIEEGKTAVIELAAASGIRLLKTTELNPLQATTFGTGELIKHALDLGVQKIILALGGSATVDGGSGLLRALGLEFLDARGQVLSHLPMALQEVAKIDATRLDPRVFQCEFIVLCDVENLLLGAEGAAPVFGPQKGASPSDVRKLEAALSCFVKIAMQQGKGDMAVLRHGGTAGGSAAGLATFLGAQLVHGIDYFLETTGFDKSVKRSDLVITGEGSIDEQTLHGKGPFGVAARAKAAGLAVIGLAGKVPLQKTKDLHQYFDILLPIAHEPLQLAAALTATAANLRRTARELGDLLALGQ